MCTFGILIGHIEAHQKFVDDAVPLFHNVMLASQLQAALSLVEAHLSSESSKSTGLTVLGVYSCVTAPYSSDNKTALIPSNFRAVFESIKGNYPDSIFLIIDSDKFDGIMTETEINENDTIWEGIISFRSTNAQSAVTRSDGKILFEKGCGEMFHRMVKDLAALEICDVEEHISHPEKDFFNHNLFQLVWSNKGGSYRFLKLQFMAIHFYSDVFVVECFIG